MYLRCVTKDCSEYYITYKDYFSVKYEQISAKNDIRKKYITIYSLSTLLGPLKH